MAKPSKKDMLQAARQNERSKASYHRKKDRLIEARRWMREHPEEAAKIRREVQEEFDSKYGGA